MPKSPDPTLRVTAKRRPTGVARPWRRRSSTPLLTSRRKNDVAALWLALCSLTLLVVLIVLLRRPLMGNTPVSPPDYSRDDSWAALPWKGDGADILPARCGADAQQGAHVDAFFVHPTA